MGQDISAKTGQVLNVILLCLILILVRVWYLSVIQHDEQLEKSYQPQRRVSIEPAPRAPIEDRFHIPLALNKIQYNAAVYYEGIRQIPSIIWEKSKEGKPVKVQARLKYIEALSQRLGKELDLDPLNIEDKMHGKASLFPHTPFVIKENITEEQYYRLRMLQKDWPGLEAQRTTKRFYPQGKTACHVIGYLGRISKERYLQIADEMQTLKNYITAREKNEKPFLPPGFYDPIQVRERLREIQEKSYTIHDFVGQAGVEAFYEEELRGIYGKKIYEISSQGTFLRELPGSRKPKGGRRVVLSISSELQEFAEQLLSAHEGPKNNSHPSVINEEWMKGGAIVAIDPKTGEILTLASYPRFNPNDFIPSKDREEKKLKENLINKWLENETYIGNVWDGLRPLDREFFSFIKGKYEEEKLPLSWPLFLDTILSPKSQAKHAINRITTIKDALDVQKKGLTHPILKEISLEADRLLVLDLCSLAANQDFFSEEILPFFEMQNLTEHHSIRQAALRFASQIKTSVQEMHYDYDFKKWRKDHFKSFLKRKREEEKKEKQYPKPYTDYLDAAQKKLFQAFWNTYHKVFLYMGVTGKSPVDSTHYPHLQPYFAEIKTLYNPLEKKDLDLEKLRHYLLSCPPHIGLAYLQTLRSFDDLNYPLGGLYKRVRKNKKDQLEKHLAASFYPLTGYGYGRSQAYRQQYALGSVFKIVTAYQALLERFEANARNLNPLILIDDLKGDHTSKSLSQILGYTEQGQPILRKYKGGILPRSSHGGMGRLDILGALEQSSDIYFSILASEHLKDPTSLTRLAHSLGFGQKTGLDLPDEAAGKVPDDLANNLTGLYSFAIGHHTFAVTAVQTAVMMSTFATQGKVIKPKVVKMLIGTEPVKEENPFFSDCGFALQEDLSRVGINFPLFTATKTNREENYIHYTPVEIERTIPFPSEVFNMIAQGMKRTVKGTRGSARPNIMRNLYNHPTAVRDYYEIHDDLLPKTGTPQEFYKQSIDIETPAYMQRHVWFATIAYPKNKALSSNPFEDPELVVVVFSKYGKAGRDAAPMAAQIVKKWREIKTKHQQTNP